LNKYKIKKRSESMKCKVKKFILKTITKKTIIKKVKNKRILVISVFILVVLFGAIIGSIMFNIKNSEPGSFEPVAFVNGEPVAYGEFKHYLEAESSEIYTYFKNKYGVEDNKDFWTTAYGGEIPIEMIKKAALDKTVRDKVQQIMARKNELVLSF
jgi:hypothetical protein